MTFCVLGRINTLLSSLKNVLGISQKKSAMNTVLLKNCKNSLNVCLIRQNLQYTISACGAIVPLVKVDILVSTLTIVTVL